jgi:hypothetical protein
MSLLLLPALWLLTRGLQTFLLLPNTTSLMLHVDTFATQQWHCLPEYKVPQIPSLVPTSIKNSECMLADWVLPSQHTKHTNSESKP